MCADSEEFYVQLLGPLSARFADVVVTPTASKQRQVLALLALRARQVVTTSTLVEELWSGRPPRSHDATVQTYVFQVRRTLATAMPAGRDIKQILSTRQSGYLLECRTDIDEVQRLALAGRSAAEAGDPRSAADLLGRALALWQGDALADVRHGPVCEIEAAALAQTRLSLLERRIDSDLAIHRYADVIGELTSLVAEHPTNERFCWLLMRALYHSGYTARALEVFRQLRASLNRDLGVEPSPLLQELHQSILSGGPAADNGTRPGQSPQGGRAGR
jgi:SARP family transcriptional regulator, regulator of embCAB operon